MYALPPLKNTFVLQMPSFLICWLVMDRWGRRWIMGVGMVCGGVLSIATVLMPEGVEKIVMSGLMFIQYISLQLILKSLRSNK